MLAIGVAGCGPKPPPSHGTAFLITISANSTSKDADKLRAIEQARAVLGKRLSKLDVPVSIESQPNARLLLKVPELSEPELSAVRRAITAQGKLEFRLVHPSSDSLLAGSNMPAGYVVLTETSRRPGGTERVERVLVSNQVELTGRAINRAFVTRNGGGTPEISLTMTAEGAGKFAAMTRDNVGRRLAIVVEGTLVSAPVIRSPITSGAAVITGDFAPPEALALAAALESALDVPLVIEEEKAF